MKTQERINRTVILIRHFGNKCTQRNDIDTQEAWEILDEIETMWEPLYRPGRREVEPIWFRPEPLWVVILAILTILAILLWI